MSQIHKEKVFELEVCRALLEQGWQVESQAIEKDCPYPRCDNYDKNNAIIPTKILEFIKNTQPNNWKKYFSNHNGSSETNFIKRLSSEITNRGILDVLKKGIKDYSGSFDLCYFKPNNNLNLDSIEKYKKNILTVVRQLHYSVSSENSIDLVFFINGLPLATMEIKTDFTQNINEAIKQYKQNRNPKNERLLTFKLGALVHFAVSSDEAYMTTKLNGEKTFFLPFNKGNEHSAGNPPYNKEKIEINEEKIGTGAGYRTCYIWQDLFSKDNILDIVSKFIHLETKEVSDKNKKGKKSEKETMIFPRYHQWQAVKKIEKAIREEGVGKKYLIQHSAGSGKSNTIAWLAYRLHSLFDKNDKNYFDQIFVLTDRKVLDKQLQNTITQFDHEKGVVQQIDENSKQLAKAIKGKVPIVISTLQKFPFVVDALNKVSRKNYAVIIDEAHSSHSGISAAKLKESLGDKKIENENIENENIEDKINKIIESNKNYDNISFFAFTATPKSKTLEIFGTKETPEEPPKAFHLYTMRQAIEEGFIMNVLKNYTTYNTVFQLAKKSEIYIKNDIDKLEGAKALTRFLKLHPTQVAQKVVIIVEHFRTNVANKINGKAKAMVVCDSREAVVRYQKEFKKYIQKRGYTDIDALVAFSGEINDPDIPVEKLNENKLNTSLNNRAIPEAFNTNEFKILIVANKYQTGFDQPLLHTMYIDKKLSGVMAVQTLSRLNRICENKSDTFILDFVNKAEDIQEAFEPYYKETLLDGETDPNLIFKQKSKLDDFGVYGVSEVDAFYKEFTRKTNGNQGALHKLIDPVVDRFKKLEIEQQKEFKSCLQTLLRFYEFVIQIVAFYNQEIEQFYYFGKLLNQKLPSESYKPINLQDDVILTYLKVDKQYEKEIELEKEKKLSPATAVGTGEIKDKEKISLDELIAKLNEIWSAEITKNDIKSFIQVVSNKMLENKDLQEDAKNNNESNFKWGAYQKAFDNSIISAMDTQRDMAMAILQDKNKMNIIKDAMLNFIYETLKKDMIHIGNTYNYNTNY